MSAYVIIPARGGSKRIPLKNVRPFHGKPMLAYPIRAAIRARDLGVDLEVWVSTEDSSISAGALAYGAETLPRPESLADDHASTAAVMAHAIEHLRIPEGTPVCCLYPCTPFVTGLDLVGGLERLRETKKCYAFPVTRMLPPPQRMLRLEEGDSVHPVWPQFNDVRSQDLEPRWRDAGQWYWGWAESWTKKIPIYYPTSVGIPVAPGKAIDIDTPEDWAIAEALYAAAWAERGATA